MPKFERLKIALVVLALCLGGAAARPASANDHIFPPAAAAKPAVDFDGRGFLVHGKRTFIVSAGMEYARVPRALWHDRLRRFQRAGFNCVEMYTFWSWHEPREGQFDFTGDHDLDAYLKLVHQMGMYAIVRIGPYSCAEWDSGGYPLWLRFKPGLRVREDNPPFLAAVDHFFDKLIPIVAANQINQGGAVILVQLENEGAGWGTDEPNPYFTHLREKAVSLGLEVPYFFSGLHHGGDPASDGPIADPSRPNPWFTTEFWSVWYDHYGSDARDAAEFGRRTWKIIAGGGGGYNYYMAHGGTNFGYSNNNEDAASYDYGAAVGQAGDLRPMYYTFKRAAWFARSFESILENSADATGDYKDALVNPAIHVTARKSPSGTIVFLDNPTGALVQTQFPSATEGMLTLAPGEIFPIVHDFPLTSNVTLRWAAARILGIAAQADTTTLVVYGPAGAWAELRFSVSSTAKVGFGAAMLRAGPAGTLRMQMPFDAVQPAECSFTVGVKRVRVLAMSDTLADRTWFVDAGGQTDIVCGPDYVGDVSLEAGRLRLTTEHPWQGWTNYPTLIYGPTGPPLRPATLHGPNVHLFLTGLSPWQVRDASLPAAPGYDDSAWLRSDTPLQMGADGDLTADAWYRAAITVPTAGQYALYANGGDRATVFLDGARLGAGKTHDGIPLTLPAGRHTLAVFTAHDGRDKLVGYSGPIALKDPKGLVGPVSIERGSRTELTAWRVLKAANGDIIKAGPPSADTPGWQPYTVGQDPFGHQPGFAWFQTIVPASVGASHVLLHFESVDDNATVFLGSTQIAAHQGWDSAFDVPLPPGPAAGVTVFVENTDGTGGLDKPVGFWTRIGGEVTAPIWKLRGGPGDPLTASGWKPLGAGDAFPGPAFFRATFAAAPPAAVGPHPIWRVLTTSLSHGSVWVNGHNLGRYPEKIRVNGLYLPECWLQPGQNSLVIYDEDGKRPDQVTIAAESAASRDVSVSTDILR